MELDQKATNLSIELEQDHTETIVDSFVPSQELLEKIDVIILQFP
jgi:hypothetical protein